MDKKVYLALLETFSGELESCHQDLTEHLLLLEKATEKSLSTHLETLFRTAHNIKGAAKSVSLGKIATLAHELEDQFSLWRDEKKRPDKKTIDHALSLSDQLLSVFKETQSRSSDILKVPLRRIEEANAKVDEFVIHQLRFDHGLSELHKLQHALGASNLNTEYLNQIIDEYSHTQVEFGRDIQLLQSILRDMRLVPISTVLEPLKRTARELSEQMHKPVKLIIEEADIHIDKVILDALRDPLQHLLRNAMDHGIESQKVRKTSKKENEATLLIHVYQEGSKIKLVFKDDGAGIDQDAIKRQAIEKGIIDNKSADLLSKSAILMLLTRPGFSTRETVSDVSGRGVGLDVVLENLKNVKGQLTIESTLGQGTEFILTLPLTLATTRGLFVIVSQQMFMLSSLDVHAIYEIQASDIKSVESDRIVVVHDQSIPIRRLSDLLDIKSFDKHGDALYGIEIGDSGRRFVLLVDAIADEHDCVIKPMVSPFDVALYSGVTLTGSNQLVPVLNSKTLIKMSEEHQFLTDIQSDNIQDNKKMYRVLVVDDSMTTRSLAANALRAKDYQVDTASDGKKAWDKINKHSYDCVITDIEMPNMNGFELTSQIKAHSDYKKTPVIIVTSRESPDEKARGLEVGAEVYLMKSQFSTHVLLEQLESLL